MSDPANPVPQGDPLPSASIVTTPATPAKVDMTSDVFAKRLEEERGKARERVLKDLGFESVDAAKAFTKTAKDLQDAQLSEQQKLAKLVEDLKPRAERSAALEHRLASLVEREFSSLPETARTAIDKQANGDPEKRLQLIELMRESGLLNAPAAAVAPAPANNAPPANQPKPSATRTKFDEWQDLSKDPRKQIAADLFFNANRLEIERARPAQ